MFAKAPAVAAQPTPPKDKLALTRAVLKARAAAATPDPYQYEIKPPALPKGVVPEGKKALIAADSMPYDFARSMMGYNVEYVGFPGYPRLAMFATRAEYRMFADAIATQLTREWITLQSSDTAGSETQSKITELNQAIIDIGLRDAIRLAAEHDSYYGRGQIFLDLEDQDRELPLILSNRTIRKGAEFRIKVVEAMWTTPSAYNAIDPSAPDFYKPSKWFMLGKEVHASRLLTIITRPVLDMLKPAFNFGGMSMSQLAEPYVDNWLRTRQSVADLINNFSITALKTSMDQVLQGSDPSAGDDLFRRAELFTLTRSNKGLMLLDNEREDLVQTNTPLSGLAELQSQAQEQMCSVSHIPAVILLGIAPTGFGNVAEGEIRTFYDWVASLQDTFWRQPIKTVIDILQLSLFGEIDPDITFSFEPLYQMTPKELADIRTADGATDCNYIDRGVLDPLEVREKLARNPESGFQGLDIDDIPSQEEEDEDVP
jgi:hypothetical protein